MTSSVLPGGPDQQQGEGGRRARPVAAMPRLVSPGLAMGVLARSAEDLRGIEEVLTPSDAADRRAVPLWTDHYSNLFQILK